MIFPDKLLELNIDINNSTIWVLTPASGGYFRRESGASRGNCAEEGMAIMAFVRETPTFPIRMSSSNHVYGTLVFCWHDKLLRSIAAAIVLVFLWVFKLGSRPLLWPLIQNQAAGTLEIRTFTEAAVVHPRA